MSEIGLHRSLAGFGAFLSVGQGVQGNTTYASSRCTSVRS